MSELILLNSIFHMFYFQRATKVNSSDFSPVRRLLNKHSHCLPSWQYTMGFDTLRDTKTIARVYTSIIVCI
jgi:hypothetical protein